MFRQKSYEEFTWNSWCRFKKLESLCVHILDSVKLESSCVPMEFQKIDNHIHELVQIGFKDHPQLREFFLKFAYVKPLCQIFLKHGFCINTVQDGFTPLTKALTTGASPDSIQMLLEAKADPNLHVSDVNPLRYAIYSAISEQNERIEKVRLLMMYGAKVDSTAFALQMSKYACWYPRTIVVKWFMEARYWSELQLMAEWGSTLSVSRLRTMLRSDTRFGPAELEKSIALAVENSTTHILLLKASRPWCLSYNEVYPESFRKVTKAVLQNADNAYQTYLPSCLIELIFSMCERDFFFIE